MRSLVLRLDRPLSIICRTADYAAGFLILVLTIDVFAEVVFRYLLGMPIRFSSELAMIIFPWMVFLSSVMITWSDGHIGIVIFRHAQKGVRRKVVEVFIYLCMLGFSVVMLVAGWNLAVGVSGNVLPITGISKMFLYIAVPVAFFLFIPVFVIRILRVLIDSDGGDAGYPAHPMDDARPTV